METYAYTAPQGNVGDDLNEVVWPEFLKGRLDAENGSIFIGIGSVLDSRFEKYNKKIVAGAGARSFETSPTLDESWTVLFVRGPLTALALGLSPEAVLSDPALLVPRVMGLNARRSAKSVGVVPYYSSDQAAWQSICNRLGYVCISPLLSPPDFLARLLECKVVFAEAMHGAILADALSIPWRPLQSYNFYAEGPTHAFKWMDFCASVHVDFDPIRLPPLPPQGSLLGAIKKRAFSEIIHRRLKFNLSGGGFRLSNLKLKNDLTEEMRMRIDNWIAAR